MAYLIDTSSLLSLVRYYLPFDQDKVLYLFFKEKVITKKEIIVIQKVLEECSSVSTGLVTKTLDYLKKTNINKEDILPNEKFYTLLDNNFSVQKLKQNLSEDEYQEVKDGYVNSADCQLILKAKQGEYTIVTEESKKGNDNKVFQKIPKICEQQEIHCISLPKLIQKYIDTKEIDISFVIPE